MSNQLGIQKMLIHFLIFINPKPIIAGWSLPSYLVKISLISQKKKKFRRKGKKGERQIDKDDVIDSMSQRRRDERKRERDQL